MDVFLFQFRNAGQTCVCANRFFVQSRIAPEFVSRLEVGAAHLAFGPCSISTMALPPQAAVRALRVGNGMEPGVQVGPLINEKAVKKVESLLAHPSLGNAAVVTGGRRHELGAHFFQPTLVYNVADNAKVSVEWSRAKD